MNSDHVSFLFKILSFVGSDISIFLERIGIKPTKKVIDGRLKRGYGIAKDGSFYITLPDDYFKEYKRYSFNFWRNVIVMILLVLISIL